MSNHFHFIVLTLDTNYMDAIKKVCYTTAFLIEFYHIYLNIPSLNFSGISPKSNICLSSSVLDFLL